MSFAVPDERWTPTFILRPFRSEDAPALTLSMNESRQHLEPWMPFAAGPMQTDHMSRQFIERAEVEFGFLTDFSLGIFAADGRVLGSTGYHLRRRPWESRYVEIGMWLHQDMAGRGFGTKVLKELVAWAFTDWPWRRLEWRCDSRNIASSKIPEKVGFRLEGCLRGESIHHQGKLRDTLVFGLPKYHADDIPVQSEIVVRPVAAMDCPQVARLHADAWQDSYGSLIPAEILAEEVRRTSVEWWSNTLTKMPEGQRHLGAFSSDGRPLGFVMWGRSQDMHLSSWEIFALAVPMAYQGSGIGSMLFDACVSELMATGASTFHIWCVRSDERALRFFERKGGKIMSGTKISEGVDFIAVKFN